MSDMKNPLEPEMSIEDRRDHALIEILMRLAAIERLLVDKGLVEQEDLLAYIKGSVDTLVEHMKASADSSLVTTMLKGSGNLKN